MTMNTISADCELLGRGPIQGSTDSDSLAAFVKQLCKQQQRSRLPGRRCSVICGGNRDIGLEIVPYQRRPDDEGFESDEDLASLGSYEDPNKGTSQKTGIPTTVIASSDSANSSGVSEDSDDADSSFLKEQHVVSTVTTGENDREIYLFSDVAFCHTDAVTLPGIAVWVIKNRKTSTTCGSGLEAIVVRGRDNKLPDVCQSYQDQSKRYKLEAKPWNGPSGSNNSSVTRRKVPVGNTTNTPQPVTEVNKYNLVQRTDTDGVTHIEVTSGPIVTLTGNSSDLRHKDGAPSSIISISTPDSPVPNETIICHDNNDENMPPPQRPERRKYKAKTEDDGSSGRQQQKVVRGQFIRVTVNNSIVPSSPEPDRKLATSTDVKNSQPAQSQSSAERLWSTADYDRPDGRYESQRRFTRQGGRTRSRSSGPSRRQQPLQIAQPIPAPITFSRYDQPVVPLPTSFGTRFFGKLREITSSSPPPLEQTVPFRRRNSVGETVTSNFYQYFSHHHHHHHPQQQQSHNFYNRIQSQQVNNGGHLKSVIKKNNKNSQPYQHYNDEPKKVTFSAYATVQVVD
ncbi:uncharacterized protein LOC126896726 [Daktulosphaira vitifoliae]|uniref:uncharacterized protein LOC126896726 n=1 Tax=Daktulosphaira vitifoliae TaxID=58002 RepID=UPI0021AA689C|nr:uncharacterized protein LOC126896726 [Daktulosphaira vitifoliae]